MVATLDEVTCPICGAFDGLHYDMKNFEPGATANPFHPRCRCTTVPYFPDDEGERIARDKEQNSYYIPEDATFSEWEYAQSEKDLKK